MKSLVGYTGFVGSNLYQNGMFDAVYNSGNIEEAYGTTPDLLIYSGLRAEKYLANNAPEKDMEQIKQAQMNIENIRPKKLVLISTIDVFKIPKDVNEESEIDTNGLHPYGYNRYQLECWVRENYPDALIIRLPGLFGQNLKKNFIYDYIHVIPYMLKEEKMTEFLAKDAELSSFYDKLDNGFYRVKQLSKQETGELKTKFKALQFSALNFTDSRSVYQFYPLQRLWNDIQIALKDDIRLWHPATEPVSAGELYYHLTGEKFSNELSGIPADYDYRTIYAESFGGENGYICSKREILNEIKKFVEDCTK